MAGGKAKPEIVAATGVENRALIPFAGRTMLACVVEALQRTDEVSGITVVGDLPDAPEYHRVADHGGFVENLFAGLRAVGDAPYVLVTTADIPFITAEGIGDFVRQGSAAGVDIAYPVVRVETCYSRFPGVKRTAVSLREGRFTGGNMMLLRPAVMLAHETRIAQIYAARKSPLKLALMLGLGTTLRSGIALTIMPSVLSIHRLESAAGRLMGGTTAAIISSYPEIATDIDRPSDLKAVGIGTDASPSG